MGAQIGIGGARIQPVGVGAQRKQRARLDDGGKRLPLDRHRPVNGILPSTEGSNT